MQLLLFARGSIFGPTDDVRVPRGNVVPVDAKTEFAHDRRVDHTPSMEGVSILAMPDHTEPNVTSFIASQTVDTEDGEARARVRPEQAGFGAVVRYEPTMHRVSRERGDASTLGVRVPTEALEATSDELRKAFRPGLAAVQVRFEKQSSEDNLIRRWPDADGEHLLV